MQCFAVIIGVGKPSHFDARFKFPCSSADLGKLAGGDARANITKATANSQLLNRFEQKGGGAHCTLCSAVHSAQAVRHAPIAPCTIHHAPCIIKEGSEIVIKTYAQLSTNAAGTLSNVSTRFSSRPNDRIPFAHDYTQLTFYF